MQKAPVDILGIIVHGHERQYDISKQRAAVQTATPRGVMQLGGKDGYDLEKLWKRSIPNRLFVLQWLFLVCTIRANAKKKRDLVLRFVDEVRERGGEILEVGSGRRTNNAEERREMLSDAFEAVTMGRMPSMTAQKGRKRRLWPPEQKDIMWAEWFSHENATNEDAADAVSKRLGFKVDQFQIWHVIRSMRAAKGVKNATGASGRPWQSNRK